MVIYRLDRGFTLVEISIVLVIVGMIVAAVTAGQSILEQAKLRTLIKDSEYYSAAYNNFVTQYDAVPGDMRDAHDYWGTPASCSDNNVITTAGGCNGDGNGAIGTGLENTAKAEDYKAWQFLALSGMIKGNYDGDRLDSYAIGVNIPASTYDGTVAVDFAYAKSAIRFTSDSAYNTPNNFVNGNVLTFGRTIGNNRVPLGAFLTVDNAEFLDKKTDDGAPHKGRVLMTTGSPVSGSVSDHCLNGSYNAFVYGHAAASCTMLYVLPR